MTYGCLHTDPSVFNGFVSLLQRSKAVRSQLVFQDMVFHYFMLFTFCVCCFFSMFILSIAFVRALPNSKNSPAQSRAPAMDAIKIAYNLGW